MKIGELVVVLGVSSAAFNSKMDAAAKKTKGLGSSTEKAGTIAKNAFGKMADAAAKMAPYLEGAAVAFEAVKKAFEITSEVAEQQEQFRNLAQAIGMATGQYEAFTAAAEQLGVSQASVTTGMQYMSRSIGNAVLRGGQYVEMFQAMGLSAKQLQSESTSEQFDEIAAKLQTVSNATQRAALTMQIFGRSGLEMAPILATGSDALAKMEAHARAVGAAMGRVDRIKMAKFQDGILSLKEDFQGFRNQLAENLAPALTQIIQTIRQMIGNGHALSSVFQGFGVVATGVADSLGVTFRGVYSGVSAVTTIIDGSLSGVTAGIEAMVDATASALRFLHISTGGALTSIKRDLDAFRQATAENSASAYKHVFSIWSMAKNGAEETKAAMVGTFSPLAESARGAKSRIDTLISSLKKQAEDYGKTADQIAAHEIMVSHASLAKKAQALHYLNELEAKKHAAKMHRQAQQLMTETVRQIPQSSYAKGMNKLHAQYDELKKLIREKAITQENAAKVYEAIELKAHALEEQREAKHQRIMLAMAKEAARKKAEMLKAEKLNHHAAHAAHHSSLAAAVTRQFDFRVPAQVLEQASGGPMLEVAKKQEQHQRQIATSTRTMARHIASIGTAHLGGAA